MALKELKQGARQIFSTVNKRIDRLQNSNTVSPAWEGLKRRRGGTGKFTIGNKDLKALQKELADAVAFYNRPTSTVGGARAFTNKLEKQIGTRVHDKDYVSYVFDLMHGIEERIPVELASNMIGTNDVLNLVIEEAVEQDINAINAESSLRDDFISKAVDKLTDMIDKTVRGSINDLDSALDDLQNRLY